MITIQPYIDRLEALKEYMNGSIGLIEYGRRVGNTTRLADFAIQFLFKHGEVIIRDHHRPNGSIEDQLHLFKIVVRRLSLEHNLSVENKNITVKRNALLIKLKQHISHDRGTTKGMSVLRGRSQNRSDR